MRIEKISENQIKFILTETDLLARNMRLHELAYGSSKAQELFSEVRQRAVSECGFHTNTETPLIIEAIPISRDSIMIIMTKIALPSDMEIAGFSPLFNHFNNISRGRPQLPPGYSPGQQPFCRHHRQTHEDAKGHNQAIFEFGSLDQATAACARISGVYIGDNTLYKYDGKYYLAIDNEKQKMPQAQENILSEYGMKFSSRDMSRLYLIEHGEIVVDKDAVGILSTYLG
ncbi:MAG: adaptor protein MecA [Clostridiales bacterium]|jgi:adapter protein MecA 1/2|nr:adaptor protein MecA [Clostridiales bacterium]